jgi:general secretion pathway protein M
VKSYLNSLSEKEKWMLISAAFCALLYGYYLFLYSPLSNQVDQKSNQLIEKTETLAWMNKVRSQDKSSLKKRSVDNSQLLTILAKQLKDNTQLKFPYQLQQTGSGDIQLSFEKVPFQLFINWLAKIDKQYTFTLKQLDVEQSETAGITKLILVMSAG